MRLAEFLNDAGKPIKRSKVRVLGVAYKKDVDDPRESPSFVLMELLLQARRRADLQRPARAQAAARCGITRRCPEMDSQRA